MTDARVGGVARLLGYAGLVPSIVSTLLVAHGVRAAAAIAAFYPLLILSFLGGIWWGFAMREGERQGVLVSLAVLPSLIALMLGCCVVLSNGSPWSLVAIGASLALTLPVDRWLVSCAIAPIGWMALRVPLSLGLGALTIATGAIVIRL